MGASSVWPLAAFLFGALATALPILGHLYIPLIDLPNHIARLHIAAASSDSPLSTYYSYSASLVPNSAADMIWRMLNFPGDPVRFAQILMAVYAVNLIAAAMVVSRVVHGRWSAWPAVAALLVYSAPFFWGFQNFVFSLPFCLYGLALWLAMEDRRWRQYRLAAFLPMAALLYLMHFFAFAILALAILGREVQRSLSIEGSVFHRVLALSINLLPFAIPVFWLAFTLLTGPESPGPSRTDYGVPLDRFWALVSPLAAPGNLGFQSMGILSVLGFSVLAVCLSRMFWGNAPRLVLNPRMKGPVIALVIAAVLAPSWLNGVALVQIRVPVVLVLLLIAGTSWRGMRVRQGALLSMIVAALIVGRGLVFDRTATLYEAEIADLALVTEALPAGARVLPLRAAGFQGERRFYHVQALLVPMREVFVPTLFQGVHALRVRDRWADHADAVQSSIDLRWLTDPSLASHPLRPSFVQNWESKFTHALLLDKTDSDALDDPRLAPLASADRFTLYKIEQMPEKVVWNDH